MPLRIAVINGPNLNLLGVREPDIYGRETLEQLDERVVQWGHRLGVEVTTFQSNHEGAAIDRIHAARADADGIVINPGALTHTSYALHDALLGVALPAVEVHLSDIHAREPWRAVSLVSAAVVRSIFGRGTIGYHDALRLLVNRAAAPYDTVSYGDHPEQVMDVRRAPDDRTGVAVFLHGGFWRREWGRDTIDTLAVDLSARGWTTANVEYRRLGCDGGWPATGEDVAAAVDRVAGDTGTDRITLVGHSAGAQLALVAARAPIVDTVVAMAPITDLARAIQLGTGAPSPEQFVGGIDPTGDVSPMAHPPRARQLIVHGVGDTVVPVEFSTRYAETATSTGADVTAVYPDIDHFSVLDPASEAWQQVAASL
jgi:3-dehydroquinate dehydratase-2